MSKAEEENLMAAAPDMLEALERVMEVIENSLGVSGWHLNGEVAEWEELELGCVIEAIEKAKGESE